MGGRSDGDAQPQAWEVGTGVGQHDRHTNTTATPTCPDIWELSNGDVAVIGRDLTASYVDRLPAGVHIGDGERLVVIPRTMMVAAKPDIPDA